MGKIRQINIKNRTYYFYNDMINIKDFDARLLKIDKKDYEEIDIYYIGYVTFKEIANCNNINSVNPLYLIIDKMIGHFEEKSGNKCTLWIAKMLQYEKIDVSEGIDVNKTSALEKCELCHYWFFKDVGFIFEKQVCNGCHDLLTMAYSLKT